MSRAHRQTDRETDTQTDRQMMWSWPGPEDNTEQRRTSHFLSVFLGEGHCLPSSLYIHYISQSIAPFSSNDLQTPLSDLRDMRVDMTDEMTSIPLWSGRYITCAKEMHTR